MRRLLSVAAASLTMVLAISACDNSDETACTAGLTQCGAACVDSTTDVANCGGCGNACGAGQVCSASACRLAFSGVTTNLPVASLTGWTQCFLGTYDVAGIGLTADIPAACTRANVLVACRPTGSDTLTAAAMAPRADVFFLTGNTDCGQNKTHVANGVGWYFDNNWSMGFAKAGDPLDLCECDVESGTNSDLRLCWHTLAGAGGYRCGATEGLNASAAWERIVFHAN